MQIAERNGVDYWAGWAIGFLDKSTQYNLYRYIRSAIARFSEALP